MNLIFYREEVEYANLMGILSKKVMEEGQTFYDVWMHQVSEEI